MTEVDPRPRGSIDLITGLIAVAGPLAVVGIAHGLWFVSDRLLYIGPMDRATIGWLVVIPIWAATPLAAGRLWRSLSLEGSSVAAAICGLVMAGIAATRFWLDVSAPGCQFGAVRQPAEWLIPAALFGMLIGGGFAIACLVAASLVRSGRPWMALILGVSLQLAAPTLAYLFTFFATYGNVCHRLPA